MTLTPAQQYNIIFGTLSFPIAQWQLTAHRSSLANPDCATCNRGGRLCSAFVSYFYRFRQTRYFNIYRTDLHQISIVDRTMSTDERYAVSFQIPKGRCRGNQFFRFYRLLSTEFGSRAIRQMAAYIRSASAALGAGEPISSNQQTARGQVGGLPTGFALHLVSVS